ACALWFQELKASAKTFESSVSLIAFWNTHA
ncbi:polyphosphate kinase 1, partial [Vibrio parahaemolyticus V-223/04]